MSHFICLKQGGSAPPNSTFDECLLHFSRAEFRICLVTFWNAVGIISGFPSWMAGFGSNHMATDWQLLTIGNCSQLFVHVFKFLRPPLKCKIDTKNDGFKMYVSFQICLFCVSMLKFQGCNLFVPQLHFKNLECYIINFSRAGLEMVRESSLNGRETFQEFGGGWWNKFMWNALWIISKDPIPSKSQILIGQTISRRVPAGDISEKSSQQFGSWEMFLMSFIQIYFPRKLTYPPEKCWLEDDSFPFWNGLFRLDIPFSSVFVKMRVLPGTFSWFQLVFLGCIQKKCVLPPKFWFFVGDMFTSWSLRDICRFRPNVLVQKFWVAWKLWPGWKILKGGGSKSWLESPKKHRLGVGNQNANPNNFDLFCWMVLIFVWLFSTMGGC